MACGERETEASLATGDGWITNCRDKDAFFAKLGGCFERLSFVANHERDDRTLVFWER